ncbi:hypothetical protein QUB08_21165 [Microcoleus sp. BR0-C5]
MAKVIRSYTNETAKICSFGLVTVDECRSTLMLQIDRTRRQN